MADDPSVPTRYASLTDAELRQLAVKPPSEPSTRAALRAELERRVATKRQSSAQGVDAATDMRTTPLVNEEILAWAPQFNLYGVTRTVGDLVFTNRRVLFARTMPLADVIGHFFWGLGALFAARESRRASEALRSQPITLIEAATNSNHRFIYVELESIVVKARRLRSSLIMVQPRVGKRTKFWGRRVGLADLVGKIPSLKQAGVPIEFQ